MTDTKCNIERLKLFLDTDSKEFAREDSKEIFFLIMPCMEKENIFKVVELIISSEKDENTNILNNLLLLEPFTLPIIEAFIESDYLENTNFLVRLDVIRRISSQIIGNLKTQKQRIRDDYRNLEPVETAEKELQRVLDEVEKHRTELQKLEEKRKKEKEIIKIKRKIQEIKEKLKVENKKELKKELNDWENLRSQILELQQEIEKSQQIFKNLPQDEG